MSCILSEDIDKYSRCAASVLTSSDNPCLVPDACMRSTTTGGISPGFGPGCSTEEWHHHPGIRGCLENYPTNICSEQNGALVFGYDVSRRREIALGVISGCFVS